MIQIDTCKHATATSSLQANDLSMHSRMTAIQHDTQGLLDDRSQRRPVATRMTLGLCKQVIVDSDRGSNKANASVSRLRTAHPPPAPPP